MKKFFLALLFAFSAAAHGSTLTGTYVSKNFFPLTFNSNGTVTTTAYGKKLEAPYKVEGNTVTFHFQGGGNPMVLKIEKDGSLTNPFAGKFKKDR